MPHIPSLGYSHCEVIHLQHFVFYPDKPIEVQITVNHIDTSDMSYVHDATVSWVEEVNLDRFTACVMAAGFNDRKSYANVTVDWLAYQGAPVGGVSGEVRISQWWTGTTCEVVKFPAVSDFFSCNLDNILVLVILNTSILRLYKIDTIEKRKAQTIAGFQCHAIQNRSK